MPLILPAVPFRIVALRKESVDRNGVPSGSGGLLQTVALRKESVDRNRKYLFLEAVSMVALRKESVDRNAFWTAPSRPLKRSLSARRAWIEIRLSCTDSVPYQRRSPQGERG